MVAYLCFKTYSIFKRFIIIPQMSHKPVTENSKKWLLLHSFSDFIGGGTFLIASIILFPGFTEKFDNQFVSSWIFTIGSLASVIANTMLWQHYTCPQFQLSVITANHSINVFASLCYLLGSTNLLEEYEDFDRAMQYFAVGSALITTSQLWKLIRILKSESSFKKSCQEHLTELLITFFAFIGGCLYFYGSLLYKKTPNHPDLLGISILCLSTGGLCFFTSSAYLSKLYFWEKIIVTKRQAQKVSPDEAEGLESGEV